LFGILVRVAAAPPTRPALRARYDQRRQEVIARAASVIAAKGFHGTTVPDLVEATGLTAGGLYHYIGSKDELLVAICDQLMAPILAECAEIAATDSPGAEQLREVVRAWMEHLSRNRELVLVFQQERALLEHGPSAAQWRHVRRQRKAFEELLAGVLARGAVDGSIALRDPDLALKALLGMVNHTASWFRPRGRLDARDVADGYVDLLLGAAH
jgi:AcrR family transcriptional regulator